MTTKRITVDPSIVLLTAKKTSFHFIVTELAIYVSQIFMFFVVAVLTSKMLTDEKSLLAFMNSKINEHSIEEVGYIVLATFLTIGMFTALTKVIKPTGWVETLSNEVLNEAPRAIYFFGSSGTGVLIAATIFLKNNPEVSAPPAAYMSYISFMFAFMVFVYGCAMSYGFKRKTHIRASK